MTTVYTLLSRGSVTTSLDCYKIFVKYSEILIFVYKRNYVVYVEILDRIS